MEWLDGDDDDDEQLTACDVTRRGASRDSEQTIVTVATDDT